MTEQLTPLSQRGFLFATSVGFSPLAEALISYFQHFRGLLYTGKPTLS
jgi:hypothetical protein